MPIDRDKIIEAAKKYAAMGRLDRAVEEYQKIVKETPDDARILLKIGDLYMKLGQFEAALNTYEKVADLYRRNEKWIKAITVYKVIRDHIRRTAPHLADQYAHITPRLAEILQRVDMVSDAMEMYDEYAAGLTKAGRFREAADVFRKIVELNPSHPLARWRFAEALMRIDEVDEAVDNLAVAAELLLGIDKPSTRDTALQVIERIIQARKDHNWIRKAAELYLAKNTEADAKKAIQKIQILNADLGYEVDTLNMLALAFKQLGADDKVVAVKFELARFALQKGKKDVALQTATELLKLAPNNKEVVAFANTLIQQQEAAPKQQQAPRQSSIISTGEVEIEVSEAFIELDDDEQVDMSDDASAIALLNQTSAHAAKSEPPGQASAYGPEAETNDAEVVYERQAAESQAIHTDEVLANAEAFLAQDDLEGALETVRVGLAQDPTAFELRFAYKDLLYQIGDYEETVNQLITLAAIYLDAEDPESAGRMLEEAYQLNSRHPRVRSMLIDLGYEVPEEDPLVEDVVESAQSAVRDPYASTLQDTAEPLPSYDLEDASGENQLPVADERPSQLLTQDDPFDAEAIPSSNRPIATNIDEPFSETSNRLPSFPLIEDATDQHMRVQQRASHPLPDYDRSNAAHANAPSLEQLDFDDQPQHGQPSHPPREETLEEALEQADLFAARGAYEEAFAILARQERLHPNNPLLLERREEIDEMRAASLSSGVPLAPSDRPIYDLNADDLDLDNFIMEESQPPPSSEDAVDVDEVFAKFKEGVAQQIASNDTQSHYDLAIAYKEMGLLDDAIKELELAAQGPEKECVSWSLIGTIYLESGDVDSAIEAFLRGLHARTRTVDQEMALFYELGKAYEQKGLNQEALYYFDSILAQDSSYRDAQQRAQALRELSGRRRKPQADQSDNPLDDLDQAFDDVFGNGSN